MGKTLDWGILEGSVGPRVRLLRNALSARSIAASAPHGLPTGSLTVLALIAANPGSSQAAPGSTSRRWSASSTSSSGAGWSSATAWRTTGAATRSRSPPPASAR